MLKIKSGNSSFSVDDAKKAREFYGNILGLRVDENEMGIRVHFPGSGEAYVYQKDDHKPASFTILNFVVDDIDSAVSELVGKGVRLEIYEGFSQDEKGIVRGIMDGMGPDIAWFKDPAGNILALVQVP